MRLFAFSHSRSLVRHSGQTSSSTCEPTAPNVQPPSTWLFAFGNRAARRFDKRLERIVMHRTTVNHRNLHAVKDDPVNLTLVSLLGNLSAFPHHFSSFISADQLTTLACLGVPIQYLTETLTCRSCIVFELKGLTMITRRSKSTSSHSSTLAAHPRRMPVSIAALIIGRKWVLAVFERREIETGIRAANQLRTDFSPASEASTVRRPAQQSFLLA